MDLLKPSYASGYAKNASQSAHPNLWDGLVGAWMPSLGVTGETLRDVSGNGNHGTLVWDGISGMNPAQSWGAGEKGTHLTFDGANDKVNCGTFLSDAQSALSICVWFKPSYVPSGAQSPFRLVSRFVGTGNTAGKVILDTNDGFGNKNGARFQVTTSNNTVYRASVGSVLEAKWLFYVGTFSQADSKIKIYKNAQELASTNTSGTIGAYNYPWTFGEDNTTISAQEWFDGNLSSVSIYNRALSPTEIKQLYIDSLAPFRKKQRVSVAVPAAVAPSATYHPLRSLAHPLEQ